MSSSTGLPSTATDTNSRMTDAELILLIKRDDPRGLSLVYELFRTEFIHWIIKFNRCGKEDAQEYYQASVMIVYDNIHQGKLESLQSSLKTYLFGIGKNLSWHHQRQEVRKQKAGAEFYLQAHVNEETREEIFAQDNNLEIVRRSFNRLGDPCHTLLDLYYYKKKSMEEITEELQYKNTDTAKNQKYKCMERLRKMVEEELVKQTVE